MEPLVTPQQKYANIAPLPLSGGSDCIMRLFSALKVIMDNSFIFPIKGHYKRKIANSSK